MVFKPLMLENKELETPIVFPPEKVSRE